MNIRRGISLVIWGGLLAVGTSFGLAYLALERSAFNPDSTIRSLADSQTYPVIRDTVIVDQLEGLIENRYPDNRLIDKAALTTIVSQTLPDNELADRFEPAVRDLYQQLEAPDKPADSTVALGFDDKKQSFYQNLEAELSTKLENLEPCPDNPYPPESAVLEYRCMPSYVSAGEATQAIMGGVRATGLSLDDSISTDTLLGAQTTERLRDVASFKQAVSALGIVATLLAAIAAILLFIKYRLTGVIATGVGLVLGGLGAWIIGLVTKDIATSSFTNSPLLTTASEALLSPFATTSGQYGAIAIASGIILIGVSSLLRSRRRRHA